MNIPLPAFGISYHADPVSIFTIQSRIEFLYSLFLYEMHLNVISRKKFSDSVGYRVPVALMRNLETPLRRIVLFPMPLHLLVDIAYDLTIRCDNSCHYLFRALD